jgi:Tfp pilus assembly protein PilV
VTALRRLWQDERGIGLIEIVIAIAIINVAILAMFAMFQAGALSILRASRTSNAAVLAEKQMELYRAMLHTDIRLNTSLVSLAASDSTHSSASVPEWGSAAQQVTSSACTNTLPECMPTQPSVTGADNRTYRVDTYIQTVTPAGGRAGKQVTVYARLASAPTKVLAKLTSNFDQATGCISGDAANPC